MAIIKRGMWTLKPELLLYNDAELEVTDNLTKILYIKSEPNDPYYRIDEEYVAEKVDGELNFIIRRIEYNIEFDEVSYSYEEYNYLYDGWTYDRGSEPARHRAFEEDAEVSEEFATWWFANALLEPTLTVDLRTIGLMPGTYTLTAQSNGEGKVSSPLSDTKEYTTDLEQLPTPVISIDDGTLTITNFGEADTIILYANNKPVRRFTSYYYDIEGDTVSFRLPRLILPEGNSTFYVQAHSKLHRSSEYSNTVIWAPTVYAVNYIIPNGYRYILNPTSLHYGEVGIVRSAAPNPAYKTKFEYCTGCSYQAGGGLGGGDEVNDTLYAPLCYAIYNATGPVEFKLGTDIELHYPTENIGSYGNSSGYSYGFTGTSSLVSNNVGDSYTTATVKLTFTLDKLATVAIQYYFSPKMITDTATFSKLDSTATYLTRKDGDGIAQSTRIIYPDVTPGTHTITVSYSKQSNYGTWASGWNYDKLTLYNLEIFDALSEDSDLIHNLTWENENLLIKNTVALPWKILEGQSLEISLQYLTHTPEQLDIEVIGADSARKANTYYTDRETLTLSNATGPVHVVIREKEE